MQLIVPYFDTYHGLQYFRDLLRLNFFHDLRDIRAEPCKFASTILKIIFYAGFGQSFSYRSQSSRNLSSCWH
jgi:hypothetical protein